jgi:hypothetical protein
MRVIRTEIYFDIENFVTYRPVGVSVAWIRGDFDVMRFQNIEELEHLTTRQGATVKRPLTPTRVERLPEELTNVIWDSFRELRTGWTLDEFRREVADYVNLVLREPIVIERSPPMHIALDDLIRAAKEKSPSVLGAVVGYVTGEGPYLLLTVPLGMLVVSSAAGLSRALDEGLYELLRSWMKKS